MDISLSVTSGHLDLILIYIVFLYFLLFLPFMPSLFLIESSILLAVNLLTASSHALFSCFFFLLYQGSGFVMCASPGVPERFEGGVWSAYKHLDSRQLRMDGLFFFFFFREEACIWAETARNMIMIAWSLDFLDARVLFLFTLTSLVRFLTLSPLFFYFNKHYELTEASGLHRDTFELHSTHSEMQNKG